MYMYIVYMCAHPLAFRSSVKHFCIKRSSSRRNQSRKKHIGTIACCTNVVAGAAPTVPASFGTKESEIMLDEKVKRHQRGEDIDIRTNIKGLMDGKFIVGYF